MRSEKHALRWNTGIGRHHWNISCVPLVKTVGDFATDRVGGLSSCCHGNKSGVRVHVATIRPIPLSNTQ